MPGYSTDRGLDTVALVDTVRAHLPPGPSHHELTAAARLRLTRAALRAYAADLARLSGAVDDALATLDHDGAPSGIIADAAVRTVPRWHFAMLNDHERTSAFAEALKRQIPQGGHVLDIGTGSGLLAMMAVSAGAGRVTTCESNPLLAELAEQIVAEHGLSEVITVVDKVSTDLVCGRDLDPADAIVSEIVDCGLVGEGLLPTMRHAREHLLVPGGDILPKAARLFGFLVDSPVIAGLNRVGTAGDFDVRLFNTVSTRRHFPVRLTTWPYRALSGTVEVARFDLCADPLADDARTVPFPVLESGEAHGLVAWFELDLGAGVRVRNAPGNARSHWMQALVLFDSPVPVASGTTPAVEVGWWDGTLTAKIVEGGGT